MIFCFLINTFLKKMSVYNFKPPFTMMVAGPSGSGKTVLVRRLLKNHRFLIPLNKDRIKVMWAYGQWQITYTEPVENADISYFDGLPSESELIDSKPDIIVIDDLMNELASDVKMGNLFTKGSHHLNINVIFITQNIFHKGNQMRNINLSCHYIIAMKNPRDLTQIDVIGRQMKMQREVTDAYFDSTKQAFGYLVINLKQDTPREMMLSTRITPEENIKGIFAPIIYRPK